MLPEAVAEGLIRPGGTVKVVFEGVANEGSEGGASPVYDCSLEGIDQGSETLRLVCPEGTGWAAERRLRLAFPVSRGMIVGQGAVLGEDGPAANGRRAVTVRLEALHLLEQRRSPRVSLPGLRATCRTAGRVVDCPAANLSSGGMLLAWPGDDPPEGEVRLGLNLPLGEPVDLRGRVVRSDSAPDGETLVAVEFLDVPGAVSERLASLCMLYEALFPTRRR